MKIFAHKTKYIIGTLIVIISALFIYYYLFILSKSELGKNIEITRTINNFSTPEFGLYTRFTLRKNISLKTVSLAAIEKEELTKSLKNENYECIPVSTIIPATIKLKNKELDGYFIKFENNYIFIPKNLFLKSFNSSVICGKITTIKDKYSGINITILEE